MVSGVGVPSGIQCKEVNKSAYKCMIGSDVVVQWFMAA
jgi:hypothetical protein